MARNKPEDWPWKARWDAWYTGKKNLGTLSDYNADDLHHLSHGARMIPCYDEGLQYLKVHSLRRGRILFQDDELAGKVSRDCNTFAADLVKRRPEQFGFWASLPLPDVGRSLNELSFALDELGAQGVCMETNHHGKYLGHPSFDPLFDELNRRKTTIFIHPTSPCAATETGCQKTFLPLPQYPIPMLEFMFDTARAVINLSLSGTVFRYPNIKYIVPHAGGALPPLIQRFSTISALLGLGMDGVSPKTVKAALKRQFYFDLAGFPFPDQIHGLLPYVSISQLLYGSDYPYTPLKGVVTPIHQIDEALPGVFPKEDDREAIYLTNARRLLESRPGGLHRSL